MIDQVFEDHISFEVTAKNSSVEFYIYENREIKISIRELGWESQYASFNLTAEEATRLKEFLIKSGY